MILPNELNTICLGVAKELVSRLPLPLSKELLPVPTQMKHFISAEGGSSSTTLLDELSKTECCECKGKMLQKLPIFRVDRFLDIFKVVFDSVMLDVVFLLSCFLGCSSLLSSLSFFFPNKFRKNCINYERKLQPTQFQVLFKTFDHQFESKKGKILIFFLPTLAGFETRINVVHTPPTTKQGEFFALPLWVKWYFNRKVDDNEQNFFSYFTKIVQQQCLEYHQDWRKSSCTLVKFSILTSFSIRLPKWKSLWPTKKKGTLLPKTTTTKTRYFC